MFSIKTTLILSFLGLFSLAFGEMSIDAQINAIKTASPEQRVKMMNDLKRNIATMQASQRRDTINKLRADISHHTMQNDSVCQNQQMQHNRDMQHSEMMMQKGEADRFMQQNYDARPSYNSQQNQFSSEKRPKMQNNYNNNWRK